MEAVKTKLIPIDGKGKDENLTTGHISLYRSIRKHWIWSDAEKLKWWIDILLEANHKEKKVLIGSDLITCKRGECIVSVLTWSKRWRTSRGKVRRFLELLKNDSMIVLKPTTKTTHLTICNYESYQGYRPSNRTTNEHQTDIKRTQPIMYNNDNNENKSKYTHNGFFEKEIANNSTGAEIEAYKLFVDYLHGVNEEKLFHKNILTLSDQIPYHQFVKLKEAAKNSGRTIKEIVSHMENRSDLTKKYKNVYLTAKNWLTTEYKKK